jgi:integrase
MTTKTFETVLMELKKPGKNWKAKSDSSLKTYGTVLVDFENFLGGRTPSIELAETFLSSKLSSKDIQKETYNTYASALRNYFHVNGVTIEKGELKLFSKCEINNVRADKYVTFKQVNEIVERLDVFQEKVIVRLLFHSGVRPGSELCSLNVGDFDFKKGKLRVKGSKGSKKIRTVKLIEPSYVIPLVKNYLKQRGMNPERLSVEDRGQPLIVARGKTKGQRITWAIVRFLCHRIRKIYPELPDLTPHWFRHGHAVWCKIDGMPLCAIQLGNTPKTCADIYSHFNELDVDRYFANRDVDKTDNEYIDPLKELEVQKVKNQELEARLKEMEAQNSVIMKALQKLEVI